MILARSLVDTPLDMQISSCGGLRIIRVIAKPVNLKPWQLIGAVCECNINYCWFDGYWSSSAATIRLDQPVLAHALFILLNLWLLLRAE